VLHGRLAELAGVHPIISYDGPFGCRLLLRNRKDVGNSFSLLRASGGDVEGWRWRGFFFLVHHRQEASLVAGSRRGGFQWHHRVPAVLDKAPVGAEKVVERCDDSGERG
jgi:hypothetical protein